MTPTTTAPAAAEAPVQKVCGRCKQPIAPTEASYFRTPTDSGAYFEHESHERCSATLAARVAELEREREALRPLAVLALHVLDDWIEPYVAQDVEAEALRLGLIQRQCGIECPDIEQCGNADCFEIALTPVAEEGRAALAVAPAAGRDSRHVALEDHVRDATNMVAPTVRTCVWAHDDIDGKWDSACGLAWVFATGGPAENDATFCPGCGNRIRAVENLYIDDDAGGARDGE